MVDRVQRAPVAKDHRQVHEHERDQRRHKEVDAALMEPDVFIPPLIGRALIRNIKQSIPAWTETLPELPVLGHKLMEQATAGKLRVEWTSRELGRLRRDIRRANRRTVGAIIGVFGVYTRHPILKLPLPWWFRAPFVGAWMNFVLTFFAYDTMAAMLVAIFGEDGIIQSPFWFTAEPRMTARMRSPSACASDSRFSRITPAPSPRT